MKKNLFGITLAGIVFVTLAGAFLHFVYELSGNTFIAGLFCSVNESTWEHLKLLFFPYLLYAVVEFFLLKREGIFFSKAVGACAGMFFIVAFFYTYTGVIGRNFAPLDVASFTAGVFVAFFTDYKMIKTDRFKAFSLNLAGILYFIIMAVLFFVFTVYPPDIPLFEPPENAALTVEQLGWY